MPSYFSFYRWRRSEVEGLARSTRRWICWHGSAWLWRWSRRSSPNKCSRWRWPCWRSSRVSWNEFVGLCFWNWLIAAWHSVTYWVAPEDCGRRISVFLKGTEQPAVNNSCEINQSRTNISQSSLAWENVEGGGNERMEKGTLNDFIWGQV